MPTGNGAWTVPAKAQGRNLKKGDNLQGQYVFSGVKHFQLFVEEGTAPESFEVKEICCINGEFIKAVHNLVLRRLIDMVEGGLN